MKRFNIYFILLVSAALLFAGGDFKKELKVEPGQLLEVDLTSGGSLEITGWDKNIVLVEANLDDDDSEDYKFDVDQNRKGVTVDVTYMGHGRRSGGINLKIYVPQKFDLEMETMGGEITIDNVSGQIRGETMGGELNLSRLNGKIKMTTMGGDITLKDSELDGELKTMGGEVLFEDVVGDIEGSSMGGDVTYRNVKRSEKSGRSSEVSISTMGGEINVDSAPSGASVSTMGGDIQIRSAAKYVKAKTMGGDIDIDAVDGEAKASTMGGDITVTMVGDPNKGERDVDLSSMGGDLTLTVPDGLSMEFDIKLTYTKRASRDYKIISDFPIKLEESEDWDYSEGSARKYIFGSGKVGGGKNRIHLDTINGNIVIKKGR